MVLASAAVVVVVDEVDLLVSVSFEATELSVADVSDFFEVLVLELSLSLTTQTSKNATSTAIPTTANIFVEGAALKLGEDGFC